MKNKYITVSVLILLVLSLFGCSNQLDSSLSESRGATEEIMAEGMDLSSYAEIPDNEIQEF